MLDFKKGAEIDAETMNLIEEVFEYPRLSIHILDSMGILGKRGAAKGARECGCREQRQPHYLRPIGRKDCQVITFNYTSYASQASPTALYFHGSLKEYVDVENKNDFLHDDLTTIDLEDFSRINLQPR